MPPKVPSALPLGKANIYPLDEPHVSQPTHLHIDADLGRLSVVRSQHGIQYSVSVDKRSG